MSMLDTMQIASFGLQMNLKFFRLLQGVIEDGLGREHDAEREGKPPFCNTGVLSLVLSAFTILMYLQALARQCLSVSESFLKSFLWPYCFDFEDISLQSLSIGTRSLNR